MGYSLLLKQLYTLMPFKAVQYFPRKTCTLWDTCAEPEKQTPNPIMHHSLVQYANELVLPAFVSGRRT
jgi:hypothetical protein